MNMKYWIYLLRLKEEILKTAIASLSTGLFGGVYKAFNELMKIRSDLAYCALNICVNAFLHDLNTTELHNTALFLDNISSEIKIRAKF